MCDGCPPPGTRLQRISRKKTAHEMSKIGTSEIGIGVNEYAPGGDPVRAGR
jgi:hypothetical protein